MIRFENISKDFGSHKVLENISFEVNRGELLVLLGASGSGKTTLLKMVNGLEKPTDGKIFINGQLLQESGLINLRKNIGYAIQQVGLFPHYTIYDNIALVPNLKKQKKGIIDEKVRFWMERLGLSFDVHSQKLPSALSGGQAQRVGLARALAGEPQLILMDEPFSALDPIIRSQIRTDFREIQKSEKITAVLVTHDLQEAINIADRICLIGDKKIQQIGSPKELIFHPANQYVKEFTQSDQFQSELIACDMATLVPFLQDETRAFHHSDSLLSVIQKSDNETNRRLMTAFYQWKEQRE